MSDAPFRVVGLFSELTKPWLTKPDWEQTVKLIDIVNEEPVSASQALAPRILKQLSDKDPKVVWLSLIVLDACVKHCPQEFVRIIANQDFMNRLVILIKNRWVKKSKAVSAKATYRNWSGQLAASMVQEWGIAFSKRQSTSPIFTYTYQKLVKMGVMFPTPHSASPMPRFTLSKEDEKKHSKGGIILHNSVKAGAAAGVHAEVKKVVDAANEGVTLLNEIIVNLGKGEKIENNEIATQVADQLEKNFETISKLVPSNLENEKSCGLLLGAHDKIETVLKKYKSLKSGGATKTEDPESSQELTEEEKDSVSDHTEDEKFHQEHILPKINAFGNPFNNFLISHEPQVTQSRTTPSTNQQVIVNPFLSPSPLPTPAPAPSPTVLSGNPFLPPSTSTPPLFTLTPGQSPFSSTGTHSLTTLPNQQPYLNMVVGQASPRTAPPQPFTQQNPFGQIGVPSTGQVGHAGLYQQQGVGGIGQHGVPSTGQGLGSMQFGMGVGYQQQQQTGHFGHVAVGQQGLGVQYGMTGTGFPQQQNVGGNMANPFL